MPLTITHPFVSAVADGADPTKVRPSNFNAAHNVAGTLDTAQITNDAVTYAKLQNVTATSRFIGRISGGAGDAEELTGTQATSLLDPFTASLKGLVPASGGGTTNFLRADGWAAPPSASPGGSNTQIQFNDSSAFGGDADLAWNKTTNTLALAAAAGGIIIGGSSLPSFSGPLQRLQINCDLTVSGADTAMIINNYGNTAASGFGAALAFRRSRASTPTGNSATLSGDGLGEIQWYGDDGSAMGHLCAGIAGRATGNGGPVGVMPAAIAFYTGIATARTHMLIDQIGLVTIMQDPAEPKAVFVGGTDTNYAALQVLDQGGNYNGISVHRYHIDVDPTYSAGASLIFSRTNNNNPALETILTNGQEIAEIRFCGSDGLIGRDVAGIRVYVDGAPSANDMPGRIDVLTTPDGSITPVRRLRINNKGNVIIGDSTNALATTATDGFLYVPTCAGTPTGVPTTVAGVAPIVINTTNNKLYFYSGGAWRDAGP
jgi:hypothetical protein